MIQTKCFNEGAIRSTMFLADGVQRMQSKNLNAARYVNQWMIWPFQVFQMYPQ